MQSLYVLIPLSVVLILAVGGLLVWAALSGQFEGLDDEGRRILDDEDTAPAAPLGQSAREDASAAVK